MAFVTHFLENCIGNGKSNVSVISLLFPLPFLKPNAVTVPLLKFVPAIQEVTTPVTDINNHVEFTILKHYFQIVES